MQFCGLACIEDFELNGLEVILDNFRSIFQVTLRRFDSKLS